MNIYSSEILNQYFTSKEFEFVNNLNLEIKKISKNIEEEQKNREIIINFMNSINEDMSLMNNKEDALGLIESIEKIFDLVNSNINILSDSLSVFNNISNKIINILARGRNK